VILLLEVVNEDVRNPGAVGDEGDGLAIGRPPRIGVVVGMRGQPAHARAVDVGQPQIEAAPVRVVVGLAQRERDELAVRRERGIADAIHHDEIVHVERMRA